MSKHSNHVHDLLIYEESVKRELKSHVISRNFQINCTTKEGRYGFQNLASGSDKPHRSHPDDRNATRLPSIEECLETARKAESRFWMTHGSFFPKDGKIKLGQEAQAACKQAFRAKQDAYTLQQVAKKDMLPVDRFEFPLTMSQEVGWIPGTLMRMKEAECSLTDKGIERKARPFGKREKPTERERPDSAPPMDAGDGSASTLREAAIPPQFDGFSTGYLPGISIEDAMMRGAKPVPDNILNIDVTPLNVAKMDQNTKNIFGTKSLPSQRTTDRRPGSSPNSPSENQASQEVSKKLDITTMNSMGIYPPVTRDLQNLPAPRVIKILTTPEQTRYQKNIQRIRAKYSRPVTNSDIVKFAQNYLHFTAGKTPFVDGTMAKKKG